MKGVQWFGPRDLRLVDMERPVPAPHEALVRVELVGVCGSDLHHYADGGIGPTRIKEPLVLGHEYAGIVEEVGADADPSLVGKRVAVEPGIPCQRCEFCRTGHYNVCPDMVFPGLPPHHGALREYVPVHAEFCFPVPDNMDAVDAAMVEPLAVSLHSVELANLRPGETIAILGLGPIGLLGAQVARFAGAGTIYGTDLHDYRVEAGKRYGVDVAFNAGKKDTIERIKDETNGRGVDVVFDMARSHETPGIACHIVRPAGRCVFTGISGGVEDPLPVCEARRKGLNIQWCRRFLHNYPTTIDLVASGRLEVRSLVTHSFPLERAPEAFELVNNFEDGVLKASVDW